MNAALAALRASARRLEDRTIEVPDRDNDAIGLEMRRRAETDDRIMRMRVGAADEDVMEKPRPQAWVAAGESPQRATASGAKTSVTR